MSDAREKLFQLFEEQREQIVEGYLEFLRFASVSTDPAHQGDLLKCADWLESFIAESGFEVERWETVGHPTLFASWLKAGPNKPTLLIYNHYDVQPVDPIELWQSPPFEPEIRNGEVFARGAQDNKGQCWYVLNALRAILARDGEFPINIKLCIEGEEETASAGLNLLLSEKSEALKADYLLVVDGGIPALDKPAATLGMRGIVTMDIECSGSATDLHSGTHGGIVYNPNHALTELLAGARDDSGRINIPGFYDDVVEASEEEVERLALDALEKEYRAMFQAETSGGEKNYSALQSAWLRPTLEINGLSGGYSGEGFKTVIPARASAKVSCRLVPNQDPEKIGKLVKDYFESKAPKGIKVRVDLHKGGGTAFRSEADSKIVRTTAQAYSEVHQLPCQYTLEGGSVPVISRLSKAAEAEVVVMGYGLASDNIHAPNEHFGIERLKMGFAVVGRIVELLGE